MKLFGDEINPNGFVYKLTQYGFCMFNNFKPLNVPVCAYYFAIQAILSGLFVFMVLPIILLGVIDGAPAFFVSEGTLSVAEGSWVFILYIAGFLIGAISAVVVAGIALIMAMMFILIYLVGYIVYATTTLSFLPFEDLWCCIPKPISPKWNWLIKKAFVWRTKLFILKLQHCKKIKVKKED